MDAPDSAQANTLALPDARPAITLGQALPFALAFEARRRQAADERAARKLARLENTVRPVSYTHLTLPTILLV